MFFATVTAAAAASLLGPAQAVASPWTLPEDDLVLSISYDFQTADQEFLPNGILQPYPLDGEFSASTLRFSGRYGFSRRFEGELTVNLKHVSYQSSPFLPALPDPGVDGEVDPVAARGAIQDFSGTALGPADIFLTGRYNLYRSLLMVTTEGSLKVPAGYAAPNPLNVTLGDGQIDYTQSLLLGTVLPSTGTFARLDVGARLRAGLPGHQAVGGLKVGQLFGERFIVFAGGDGAYTITEGGTRTDPGQPFVEDPSLPFTQVGADDVKFRPFTLDKDWFRVEAGVIFRFGVLEVQVSYNRTLAGSNIAAIQGVTVSSLLLTSTAERDVAAPSEEGVEQPVEPEYIEEVIIEEVPVGTPLQEGEEVIIEEVPVEQEGEDAEEEGEEEEVPRPPIQPTDDMGDAPPTGGAAAP